MINPFLAHLSRSDKVIIRDLSSSVICLRRPLTVDLNDISSQTTGLILTKLGRIDPYIVLFNKCSNELGQLHI